MNTNTQATFTTPDAVELPITVYYDQSCKLCRSEIENLAARDEEGVLKMMDCSGANFDASQLPFDQKTLMNCIHAIDAKGEWLKATDVFVVCYRAAQMQGIAKAFAFAKPVAERIYPWIVRNRYVLSSLGVHKLFNALTYKTTQRKALLAMAFSQACKDGVCEIAPSMTNKNGASA
jgi:predicted DCC family thiol-disulfide oxidoreductase YuxK